MKKHKASDIQCMNQFKGSLDIKSFQVLTPMFLLMRIEYDFKMIIKL